MVAQTGPIPKRFLPETGVFYVKKREFEGQKSNSRATGPGQRGGKP
jgi:hypothetical protein